MSDIEKIRQEIERLENMDYPCDTSEQATGFYNALDCLSDFIDSLPEEKPSEDLEEAAKNIYKVPFGTRAEDFIAGAEWTFRQGWTFDAHKGAFGICFDGNIDNLLDSLKDKEEVTVQIRKK